LVGDAGIAAAREERRLVYHAERFWLVGFGESRMVGTATIATFNENRAVSGEGAI